MWKIAVVIVIVIVLLWCAHSLRGPLQSNYYFDWNGTAIPYTGLATSYMRTFQLGNPSANYAQSAQQIIAKVRNDVAGWAGICEQTWHIVFTSGGSESISSYLQGMCSGHNRPLITTAAEHKATLLCAAALQRSGTTVSILPVGIDAALDPDVLGRYLDAQSPTPVAGVVQEADLPLVSVLAANNETGTLNDLAAIARTCSGRSILHVDAVQTFGKYPNIGKYCDAFSASAHKFGGPTGIGILAYKKSAAPSPIIFGTQQGAARGGTENVSGIAGLGAALEQTKLNAAKSAVSMANHIQNLASALASTYPIVPLANLVAIAARDGDDAARAKIARVPAAAHVPAAAYVIVPITGSAGHQSTSNTLNFAIVAPGRNFCNIKFREALARRKIIISVGSACNTGASGPNHVLVAIGAPKVVRAGAVRISIGPTTSSSDMDVLLAGIKQVLSSGEALL